MDRLKIYLVSFCIIAGFCNVKAESMGFSIEPEYAGEVHIGYGSTSKINGFNTLQGRVSFGTIQGVKLCEYFQVGAGLDFLLFTHHYAGQQMRTGMTIFGDFRGMYPLNNSITPFLDLALGGYFGFNKNGGSAFYCEFGPGIKYNNWALSLGLDAIGTESGSCTFFIKIGYWF